MKKESPHPIPCRHCNTRFTPSHNEREFCCSGCRYVYQLIHNKGLNHFYDLKNKTIPPAGSSVFHRSDLNWIKDLISSVESTQSNPEIELEIRGISCVGCVWLIERIFRDFPGSRTIRVMPNQGKLRLGWKHQAFDALAFFEDLESLGYRVGLPGKEAPSTLSPLLTRLGLATALALNTMLFTLPFYLGMDRSNRLAPLLTSIAFLLATGSLLIGGSYFFKRCWISLKMRELHMDLPISLGLLGAYVGSVIGWIREEQSLLYFDFVAVFCALMLTGRYLQERAIESNRRRLLSSSFWTQRWQTWRNGRPAHREARELCRGDHVSIPPGQVIPVRGTLLKHAAMIGLDWITGESQPFLARPGTSIPPGAINVSVSEISIESSQDWIHSQLKHLMEISDQPLSPNPLLEKIIRIYLFVVIMLSLAGACGWLAVGTPWPLALQIAISVLVVSCPCALGIALPLVDELTVKAARNAGVFIRETSLWHRLSSIRTIVFDKTGTLTLETPALSDEKALHSLNPEEQAILLNMVSTSPHPASRALRESLQKYAPQHRPTPPESITETPGSGLEWIHDKTCWRVGRPEWATHNSLPPSSADCVLTRDGALLAEFSFIEEVRKDAGREIQALLIEGYEVFLLSGDRPANVQRMATRLGLAPENGIGGKTPREKADWIRHRPPSSCLMVGDGANDSLAFNEAHCRATPATSRSLLEQKADYYFLGDNIHGIRKVFQLSRQRLVAIRRVLAFTVIYNLAAVTCALSGWINPLVAAVIMPLSSICSLLICSISKPKQGRPQS